MELKDSEDLGVPVESSLQSVPAATGHFGTPLAIHCLGNGVDTDDGGC